MTVATCVCWSMISLIQIEYKSRVLRQGRSRAAAANQARSARANLRRAAGVSSRARPSIDSSLTVFLGNSRWLEHLDRRAVGNERAAGGTTQSTGPRLAIKTGNFS